MGLMALALSAALSTAAIADSKCELKLVDSLALETESSGAVTIPVMIDNRPARLLIDTGAPFSILDTSFARTLGHEPSFFQPGTFFGMVGGYKLRQSVAVDSLSVGRLKAMTSSAMGTLGSNVLAAYDVELDFAAQKMNMFTQDHCPGQVVYWTNDAYAQVPMTLNRDQHITIPVTLDGKNVTAIVDTGAYRSYMTLDIASDLFGFDENSPGLKKVGDTKLNNVAAATLYRYPFQSLTFQDVAVRNPDIEISKEGKSTPGMPQLVVGLGILRQLHMYVAYRERMLYLTPAAAH